MIYIDLDKIPRPERSGVMGILLSLSMLMEMVSPAAVVCLWRDTMQQIARPIERQAQLVHPHVTWITPGRGASDRQKMKGCLIELDHESGIERLALPKGYCDTPDPASLGVWIAIPPMNCPASVGGAVVHCYDLVLQLEHDPPIEWPYGSIKAYRFVLSGQAG